MEPVCYVTKYYIDDNLVVSEDWWGIPIISWYQHVVSCMKDRINQYGGQVYICDIYENVIEVIC